MTDPAPYSRRSPFEHERDISEHDTRDVLTKLPPVDTFAETEDGFIAYRNGVEVWRASVHSYPHIMMVMAKRLRG